MSLLRLAPDISASKGVTSRTLLAPGASHSTLEHATLHHLTLDIIQPGQKIFSTAPTLKGDLIFF